jgi:hypothetical protein
MPWGHPDAKEALWCVVCGLYGRDFVQRRFLNGEPQPPTARVRICPRCHDLGWGLCGAGVEEGKFFVPHLRLIPKTTAEAVA